ncbi:Panacea domain-containing protein [Arthrobacter sp. TMN-50]
MTNSTDVLRYLRSRYPTTGRMQRQKLLYYSQAWHLTWNGSPLFQDAVEAWELGPVARDAWRADNALSNEADLPAGDDLSDDQKATVDAIVAFYGRMTGGQLSDLTHDEYPWKSAYEDVSPIMRGSVEIKPTVMRRHYSIAAMRDDPRPVKPTGHGRQMTVEETRAVAAVELPRWRGVMQLLADR